LQLALAIRGDAKNQRSAESLARYRLANPNVVMGVPFEVKKLFIEVELSNVFDRDYEVFQYYPMPGRNFRVTLGFEH